MSLHARLSFPRHLGWSLMALALTTSSALAQTGGYALKTLNPPFLSSWTACGAQYLGDNGDVLGRCGTFAGIEIQSGFPVMFTTYRPIVWRSGAGSPISLSLPSGQSAVQIHGIDAKGRVSATLAPTRGGTFSMVTWDGNQRTPWATTYSFLDWHLTRGLTADGFLAASSHYIDRDGAHIVIADAQTRREIPVPPNVAAGMGKVQLHAAGSGYMLWLNERGQIALVTSDDNPDFSGPSYIHSRAWFWNGQVWREIAPPADPGSWQANSTLLVRGLNATGQVLLSEYAIEGTLVRDKRYVWSESTGLVALPDDVHMYASEGLHIVADSGDVFGQAQFSNVQDLPRIGRYRAAVWRNGQMIDLNTLVKPPSGYAFVDVLDVNAQGQVLVYMDALNAGTNTSKLRPALLLPR
ncbi:MAG: hypothetical protein QM742_18460 [Aquabacterium sp.]